MNRNITENVKKKVQLSRRARVRHRVEAVLAIAIVLSTVFSLMLPAATLEAQAVCGLEEHTHTEECYTETRTLTCELEESAGHTHTEECYDENGELVCKEEELPGHTHGEDCFTVEKVLICEKEEHVHTAACYPDAAAEPSPTPEPSAEPSTEPSPAPTVEPDGDLSADLESAETWEQTFADAALTGEWAKDLVAIARTQLGYSESTANYIVKDGRHLGYTRYGAWYGNAHGDWCAMFLSFCLHYAGIPEDTVPHGAECQSWIDALKKKDTEEGTELYKAYELYTPVSGDFVFFDLDRDGDADHVGLVEEVENDEGVITLKTIEGNSNDMVRRASYSITDETVMGYLALPQKPETQKPRGVMRAAAAVNTGSCGKDGSDLQWSLQDGVLRITGSGAMEDYSAGNRPSWFEMRGQIKKVIIDEGVTSIGGWAFCDIMTEDFTFPGTLEEIGERAFLNAGVGSFTAPARLKKIGIAAFSGNKSMTSLVLDHEIEMGTDVFADTGLKTAVVSSKNVNINLFKNCSSLETVELRNAESIRGNAFDGCSSLVSVTLPETLKTIEKDSFRDCSSLTGLAIPAVTGNIGNYNGGMNFDTPFGGCGQLVLTVDGDNAKFASVSGALYNKEMTTLIAAPGATEVEIPAGVTQIANQAMKGNRNLTTVSLPDTVTTIGSGAFANCPNLTAINAAETHPTLSSVDGGLYNKEKTQLIAVPSGLASTEEAPFKPLTTVTSIATHAFQGCEKLEVVDLSGCSQLVTIGESEAFYDVPSLRKVVFGENLTGITGQNALANCPSLQGLYFRGNPPQFGANLLAGSGGMNGDPDNGNVIFYYRKEHEKTDANPTGWTEPTWTDNNRKVRRTLLWESENLTENSWWTLENGVLTVSGTYLPTSWQNANQAPWYSHVNEIHHVKIAEGIRNLPRNLFRGYPQLLTAELPSTLKEMGDSVFQDCAKLHSVHLNGKEDGGLAELTRIPGYTFANCTQLAEVDFRAAGTNLTEIGEYAFSGSSLTSFDFSPFTNLINLGSFVFQSCSALKIVRGLEDTGVTLLSEGTFCNCSRLEEIKLPEGLTKIDNFSFYHCAGIKYLEFPKTLKAISGGCSFEAIGLKMIVFPDSLVYLHFGAFTKCPNLECVTFGTGLTSIPERCFYGSSHLQELVFPEGCQIQTIGKDAFAKTGFISFTVPDSVTTVESGAFASCPKLISIDFNHTKWLNGSTGGVCYDSRILRDVDLGDSLIRFQNSPFAFTNVTELTIPESFQRVGDPWGLDISLTDLVWNAENGKWNTAPISGRRISMHLTLGKTVDSIDATTWLGFTQRLNTTSITFEGENVLTLPKLTGNLPVPLKDLPAGDYYADENGALYLLNKEKNNYTSATLVYVPEGLKEYTIPASITYTEKTADGAAEVALTNLPVTGVRSYALKAAKQLTQLTVQNPDAFTKLDSFAFADVPTLTSVNGLTVREEALKLFSSAECGLGIFDNTGLTGKNADQGVAEVVKVTSSGKDVLTIQEESKLKRQTEGDPRSYLYTGQTSKITIGCSNAEKSDTYQYVRIFYRLNGSGGQAGGSGENFYTEGTQTIVVKQGNTQAEMKTVEMEVKELSPGLWCAVLQRPTDGETVTLNLGTVFPSPTSPGGSLTVWGDVSKEKDFTLAQIGQCVQTVWEIKKGEPTATLDKNGAGYSGLVGGTATETGEDGTVTTTPIVYLTGLSFAATHTAKSNGLVDADSEGNSMEVGKDYVRSVAASMTFKESELGVDESGAPVFHWSEDVKNAIQSGNVIWVGNAAYCKDADGRPGKKILTFGANVLDPSLSMDENGDLKVSFTRPNPASNSEINAVTSVTFGDEVLAAPAEKVSLEETYRVSAHLDSEFSYTHSGPEKVPGVNAELDVQAKQGKLRLSNLPVKKAAYMGEEQDYEVRVWYDGALPYTQMGSVEEALQPTLYLAADDIAELYRGLGTTDLEDSNLIMRPEDVVIQITKATLIAPGDQGERTDKDGKLVSTQPDDTGDFNEKKYDGTAKFEDLPVREGCRRNVTLTIAADPENPGRLKITAKVGNNVVYTESGVEPTEDGIQNALDSMGYIVDKECTYKVTWSNLDSDGKPRPVYGGTDTTRTVPATVKDSFKYLDGDVDYQFRNVTQDSVKVSTTAAVKTPTGGNVLPVVASGDNLVPRDATITGWNAYVNGLNVTQKDAPNDIVPGSVITYQAETIVRGDMKLGLVPAAAHVSQSQTVIVSVKENPDLKAPNGEALTVITIDGVEYYLLDQPGEYKNVTVNGVTADKITVQKLSDYNIDTVINWYEDGYRGQTKLEQFTFQTIAGSSVKQGADGTITAGSVIGLQAEFWLNDLQAHRLHAGWGGGFLTHSKYIVPEVGFRDEMPYVGLAVDGKQKSDMDESFTRVILNQPGQQVIYRLALKSLAEKGNTITLTGNDLRDRLPYSLKGVLNWEKGVNVTIEYDMNGDPANRVENENSWRIDTQEMYGDDRSQQIIVWEPEFKATFGNTPLYIYVTVTFPEKEEDWRAYVRQYGGSCLENIFSRQQIDDIVYHYPQIEGEAVLQKGVYATGTWSGIGENSIKYRNDIDPASRQTYSNDDTAYHTVTYYVSLYNSGSARLYVNELQDILPKGFHLKSMGSPGEWKRDVTMGNNEEKKAAATCLTGSSAAYSTIDRETVTYVSAQVEVKEEKLAQSTGDSRLTFTVSELPNGYDQKRYTNPIRRDPVLDQLYLMPGEALEFAYVCRTNQVEDTEAVAPNTVAMSYYDYNHAGIKVGEPRASAKPLMVDGAAAAVNNNDGDCRLLPYDAVREQGFYHSDETRKWLVSDVTLKRTGTKPGITKTVQSNGQQVKSADVRIGDVQTWTTTVLNDGESTLMDYMITDTMQFPYRFDDGDMIYKIFAPNAQSGSGSWEGVLFAFNGYESPVNDDDKWNCGAIKLRVSEGECKLPSGAKIKDGIISLPIGTSIETAPVLTLTKTRNNTTGNKKTTVKVAFVKNVNGEGRLFEQSLTMYLYFPDAGMAIPEHGKGVLTYQTKTPGGTPSYNRTFVNSAFLTPLQQELWEEEAANGREITGITNKSITGTDTETFRTVTDSAQVNTSASSSTTSEKRVTDVENGSTANSTSGSGKILLTPENTSRTVRYALETCFNANGGEAPRSLVIIDNLPVPNDHSTFIESAPRYSDFEVKFKDGAVDVYVENKGVRTKLETGFTVGFSKVTEFTESDWAGEDSENWAAYTADARALRVVLANAEALTPGRKVIVEFDAVVSKDAKPGETAWNSFGYHYALDAANTSYLEAAPPPVGVMIPSVPWVQKRLEDRQGRAYQADADTNFRFLIYEGGADLLTDGMTEAEIAAALKESKFTVVDVPVEAEKSASEWVILDPYAVNEAGAPIEEARTKVYRYENDEWKKTDTPWKWAEGEKYTILELPCDDGYYFSSMGGNTAPRQTFTFNGAVRKTLVGVNVKKDLTVVLNKADADHTHVPLAGAVFGLYSLDKKEMAKEPIALPDGKPVDMEITLSGKEGEPQTPLYLVGIKTTASDGSVTWSGLPNETYYYMELRAPDGYRLPPLEPKVVRREKNHDTQNITVPNQSVYELPKAGGEGRLPYWLGGAALLTAGLALFVALRKKRRFAEFR